MHVATNELVVVINPVNPIPPILDLERISSYNRAINIMSKVLSFIKSSADPLLKLVMQEQCLRCNSIYSHLANPRINVNIDVKNTIKDLDLHLIDDVIRAKGRLINSELSLEAQTPLFLPNRSRLVDLIVRHIHQIHNHCGLSQTLSVFRQSFWSPKIRSRLKSPILRCVICRRQRARTIAKPPPPPLPTERVQWKHLFSTVAIDHTGHFYARDTYGNYIKLYLCLFVCATTRAVHLEVVDNLSATSFILCLRCLAAAKGIPSLIIFDNHKTFISGEKFLLDLQEDDDVREFLQNHCIQWRHQTSRSPWMGGHFERLVRTIKTSLSSAIASVKAPLANSRINWVYDSPPRQSHHIAPRQTTPKSKTNMITRKSHDKKPRNNIENNNENQANNSPKNNVENSNNNQGHNSLPPKKKRNRYYRRERRAIERAERGEMFNHDARWASQRPGDPSSSSVPMGMTHSGPQHGDPISTMRPAVYYPHESVGNSLTNDNSPFQIGREAGEFPGLYKPADPDPQHDTWTYSSIANSLETGPPSPTRTLAAYSSDSRTRPGIVYPLPDTTIEVEASLPEPAALRRADLQPSREVPTNLTRTTKRLSRKRRRNRSTALYRPAKRSPPWGHWCTL